MVGDQPAGDPCRHSALHHEADVFEHLHVASGIAGNRDDVGVAAGLDRADVLGDPRSGRRRWRWPPRIASIGVMPARTMIANSWAFSPWRDMPKVSVPKAIFTPAA
jgi:hypothetical protein